MTSLEKLEEWIHSQYVYDGDSNVDLVATKNNFLAICGTNGTVDIKALSSETGITRSVFYHNSDVKNRIKSLKKNLNKQFPGDFSGASRKKRNNGPKKDDAQHTNIEQYQQDASVVMNLSRHNAELEKQLHEEKAKNAKLEMDIEALKKELKAYGPSVKALFELGAFPMPVKPQVSDQ